MPHNNAPAVIYRSLPLVAIARPCTLNRSCIDYSDMDAIYLAVNGTLMRGLELNSNLLNVGATFIREDETEAAYRLWSIGDRHPAMQKVKFGGRAIAVEIWALPPAAFSTLLQQEPPGLCIGKVRLASGEDVLGVLGEAFLCEGQPEITQWGGWRAYTATLTV